MSHAIRLFSHPRDDDQSGLFSVVLVTFLLISYPLLQPDPTDTTNRLLTINNQLLTQISLQSPSNGTGSSQPLSPDNDSSSQSPRFAVRVNAIWLVSLFLSVACPLWATLLQQWARSFLRAADRQDGDSEHTPSEHALIYARFLDGVEHLRLPAAVNVLPLLLHTSVFLFTLGLIDLLFHVNHTVAYVWMTCIVIGCLIYAIITFMPLVYHNSPYYTPPSSICWFIIEATSLLWLWLRRRQDIRNGWAVIRKGMRYALESKVIEPTKEPTGISRAEAEIKVLKSMMKSLGEEQEFQDFLDGLPGLFKESNPPYLKKLREGLQESVEPIIDKLFATCTATSLLPEALRSQRLTACLGAVWCFYDTIDRHFRAIWEQWDKVTNDPWGPLLMETWAEASRMTTNPDSFIAVRAHCIQALMAVMWKKGRWQCASPRAIELLKYQLDVPSLDVGWLTNEDQLQLAVAANLLSKSLPLLDGQGTSADTNLKIKLKEILDSICRELDVSDVPPELQDRFVDGAEVMKVFNIQDVDASFGRAAFGPCAKIVK